MTDRLERVPPLDAIRAAQKRLLEAERNSILDYVGDAYRDGSEVWPFFHAASRALSMHYFEQPLADHELPSHETARQSFLDFAHLCHIARNEHAHAPEGSQHRARLRGSLNELILQALVAGGRAAGEPVAMTAASAEDDYGFSPAGPDNQNFDVTLHRALRDITSGRERLLSPTNLQITSHNQLEHLMSYDLNKIVVVVPEELFRLVPTGMPKTRNAIASLILGVASDNASPDTLQTLVPYSRALQQYVTRRQDIVLMEHMLEDL